MADRDLRPIHVIRNGRCVRARTWSPGETRSVAVAGAPPLAVGLASRDADAALGSHPLRAAASALPDAAEVLPVSARRIAQAAAGIDSYR